MTRFAAVLLSAFAVWTACGFTIQSVNFHGNHLSTGIRQNCRVWSPSHATASKLPTQRCLSADSPARGALVSLRMTSLQDEESPSWGINPLYSTLWVAFLGYAFGIAPAPSTIDTDILNAAIQDPVGLPGFSNLFAAVFNFLGILPMVMACICVPSSSKKGLPSALFLVAGEAFGYVAIGIYLALRAPPPDDKIVLSERSWLTRNVLENKLFAWTLVLLTVSIPFSTGAVEALQSDAQGAWQGFWDLISTSQLAASSSVDGLILSFAMATLIPRDYKLRTAGTSDTTATLLAASTLLLPFLGGALYCALRPPLPDEAQVQG